MAIDDTTTMCAFNESSINQYIYGNAGPHDSHASLSELLLAGCHILLMKRIIQFLIVSRSFQFQSAKKRWWGMWGDVGTVGARELRGGRGEIQRREQTEKFRMLWRHDVLCGSMY